MQRFVSLFFACSLLSCSSEKKFADVSTPVEKEPTAINLSTPSLHYSIYDKTQLPYLLYQIEPEKEPEAFIIHLGLSENLPEISPTPAWIAHIPSREAMNYQLFAEGDFWNILKEIYSKNSELLQLPKILLGTDSGNNAALSFANNYRSSFDAILFSGGSLGLNLPNLDNFPIVYSPLNDQSLSTPWGRDFLIKRLQDRGNPYAHTEKDFQTALNKLISISKKDPSLSNISYVFNNYQHSQAFPWLKVISKNSEAEPVKITVKTMEDELIIEALNAYSLQITKNKKFPKKIEKIRVNGSLYTFTKKTKKLLIGGDHLQLSAKKNDTPPGFLNFFRNEPLIIVYQDKEEKESFIIKAEELAKSLASLKFSGFPLLNASIEVLPLSSYKKKKLPVHRAIFIGKHKQLQNILSNDSEYFPIQLKNNAISILNKPLPLPQDKITSTAYGMIYPPEKLGDLKLAMLLSANDTEGLEVLKKNYLSATALYRESDVRLWTKQDKDFVFSGEFTFDSYWGKTDIPTKVVSIPRQSQQTWNDFLESLVVLYSQTKHKLINSFTSQNLLTPTDLSIASLNSFISEQSFSIISLQGGKNSSAERKILKKIMNKQKLNFENLENFEQKITIDCSSLIKKKALVLVDNLDLNELSQEERASINYELLPYSLKEITLQSFEKSPEDFSKGLVQMNTEQLL